MCVDLVFSRVEVSVSLSIHVTKYYKAYFITETIDRKVLKKKPVSANVKKKKVCAYICTYECMYGQIPIYLTRV